MTATAILSRKFQLTIPKAIREKQGWETGQEFAFILKGSGVLIMPVPTFEEIKGIAKNAKSRDYRDR